VTGAGRGETTEGKGVRGRLRAAGGRGWEGRKRSSEIIVRSSHTVPMYPFTRHPFRSERGDHASMPWSSAHSRSGCT
jgi:hypothetical protein